MLTTSSNSPYLTLFLRLKQKIVVNAFYFMQNENAIFDRPVILILDDNYVDTAKLSWWEYVSKAIYGRNRVVDRLFVAKKALYAKRFIL